MNVEPTNDRQFIAHLTEIVLSNLKNDQFGVSELAREVGKSRSYIHRRLKPITKESASQFICRIKLERAKEMLTLEGITISEIAYDVGFSSPSYFIKCFHDHYGVSPGDFLKNNKVERASVNIDSISRKLISSSKRRWYLNRFVWISFLFLLASAMFLAKYIHQVNHLGNREKSIVLLPLRNVGEDQETQILAEGMMEDILNRLSQIEGLQVKSQLTAEKYKHTNKSIFDIGKELGVSYVLVGTIMREGGKIRFYISMVDAKQNRRIWGKQYDREIMNMFDFITDVSKGMAEELEVILSPEEVEKIEKLYTEDTEAYRLYQKGRFFWHRRTEEGLNNSIFYFNEALKLDSTYALAYAGLADAYYIQAWWGWYNRDKGYQQSKEFAVKALELDNDLAEAHNTLGGIYCYHDFNWKLAEEEFRLAIKLQPNYADALQYYSEYLDILGRNDQARIEINKAIELDPVGGIKYYLSSLYYYNQGKFTEALRDGKKVLELDSNFRKQYFKNFLIYFHLKEYEVAIFNIVELLNIDFPNEDYTYLLNRILKENGMNEVVHWIIEKYTKSSVVEYYYMAQLYALLVDKNATLDYLEKEYQNSSKIPRMKNCYDFRYLHTETRFVALLEKMNLRNE